MAAGAMGVAAVGATSVGDLAPTPALAAPVCSAGVCTETFTYTGAEQTFTVPPKVTSIDVVLVGGAGGQGAFYGDPYWPGGAGARVAATVLVTPATTLFVNVGGNGGSGLSGGFNGGANSGASGGGGGGASDIRTCSRNDAGCNSLASRLLVAGGGGGAGRGALNGVGGKGGDAGAVPSDGGPGTSTDGLVTPGTGGKGATLNAGGAAGVDGMPPISGVDPFPGTLGGGGSGGGGGGGGRYGGGGGGYHGYFDDSDDHNHASGQGGGGAGSSFAPGGTITTDSTRVPKIVITYADPTTTTTVMSSANPSTFGSGVTFTATVNGGTALNGTVQFRVDGADYGLPVALAAGTATSGNVDVASGAHDIEAIYSGDSDHLGSVGTATQTVNKASSSTTVTSSPEPASFGDTVTFTATVTAAGAPTGTVQFVDGVTPVGSPIVIDASGQASFAVSATTVGTTTVTAHYAGDANHLASDGSAPHSVGPASSQTSVQSSRNPSGYGNPVALTATVTGAGTPTGAVQFLVDGMAVGDPVAVGPGGQAVSPPLTDLVVGTHQMDAVYSGDAEHVGSTGTMSQQIDIVTTAVTIQAPESLLAGQPIALAATVVGSDAVDEPRGLAAAVSLAGPSGVPTGTVQFVIDGTPLGSPVVVGADGTAQAPPIASRPAGAFTVVAQYSGDAGHAPSSTSLALTVATAPTGTTATVSVSGSTINIDIVVVVLPPASGVPTGTVDIVIDGVVVATVPLDASGKATAPVASTPGPHTIVVNFEGTAVYSSSTSPAQAVEVATPSTTAPPTTAPPTTAPPTTAQIGPPTSASGGPAPVDLPSTGSNIGGLGSAAALVLMAGSLIVLAVRRRRAA